ncbi:hypothetical protein [Streptomyces sp. NPDC088725]|uniref:hypothetical protein n=1 Tax=Streptomyces sp. NPDC088725 TaxID=3365873 RepID=UPI00382C46AA
MSKKKTSKATQGADVKIKVGVRLRVSPRGQVRPTVRLLAMVVVLIVLNVLGYLL